MRALIVFMSFVTFHVGCSLDSKYFEPRKTDSYTLGYSVIPQSQVEEVSFTSNGETIYGVFAKAASVGATTKTILYFHGDDKDIDKFWPRVESLYKLGNLNVFIFDYQGYGKSTGSPSLSDIKINSEDALTYLKTRADVNDDRIVYYAYSLGAVFAFDLATKVEMPFAMITESAPASSDQMVRSSVSVGIPGSFFFNETFDNLELVDEITSPILLIHGEEDDTVPFKDNGSPMFDEANEPKSTLKVLNAGHSDVIDVLTEATYLETIQTFFSDNNL